ncbi:MAG: acetylornithine deacetylase [Flavobacteriaceae bacterium]
MTDTLDILERLVAFPTVSADSNLALIDYVGEFLAARGFDLFRFADETGLKAGLFASLGPRDAPGIMLSGHTDVVPVEGQPWTREPFALTRAGERVFGRGTTDMKGFLACMLSAAGRAAARDLAQPLKLAFSWDEEIGCIGIPQMLPHLDAAVGRPALCIVGEPTSMQIALSHKGKVALRAVCTGTNGHSAMAPNYLNAIHIAADFIGRMRELQTRLGQTGVREEGYDIPYTTVHVGKVSGGKALNIVPEKAVVDFEFRYPASEDAAAIRAEIDAAARETVEPLLARFPEAGIEIGTLFAYPGLGISPDDDAMTLMRKIAPRAGLTRVGYGTEGGYFSGMGIPTVVCGPGSMEQGHKPDEFIALSELAACDAMCDRVLDRLCGAAPR